MSEFCARATDVLRIVAIGVHDGARSDELHVLYEAAVRRLALCVTVDERDARLVALMVRQRVRALAHIDAFEWSAARRALRSADRQFAALVADVPRPLSAAHPSMHTALTTGDAATAGELVGGGAPAGADETQTLLERLHDPVTPARERSSLGAALGAGLARRTAAAPRTPHALRAAHTGASAPRTARSLADVPQPTSDERWLAEFYAPIEAAAGERGAAALVQRDAAKRSVSVTALDAMWRVRALDLATSEQQLVAAIEARGESAEEAMIESALEVDARFAMSLVVLESVVQLARVGGGGATEALRYEYARVARLVVVSWAVVAYERIYRCAAVQLGTLARFGAARDTAAHDAGVELADVVRALAARVGEESRASKTLLDDFFVGLGRALRDAPLDADDRRALLVAGESLSVQMRAIAAHTACGAALLGADGADVGAAEQFVAGGKTVWREAVGLVVAQSMALARVSVLLLRTERWCA